MRVPALLAAAGAALLACTATSGSTAATPPASALVTSSASSTAAGATTSSWPDWYAYHQDAARDGWARNQPAPTGSLKMLGNIALDGAVYASPLVIGNRTIVATENNTIYAFDGSYRVLWKRHVGAPATNNDHPCGNINPLGITGTPSYAASTNSVYVAAELHGDPPTHRLYAIDFGTGAVRWSRTLDFAGADQRVMQERGAVLTLSSGVYVPFGGLAGDCGNYKGRIVRYSLTGSGATTFTVPTAREAGMWTPPGPVWDGANIYVAVGNGASGAGDAYDYSDSILKLTTTLSRVDYFAPTNWASENDNDVDLGSQGPAVVGKWIFSAGKSGTAYVLNRSKLGGIGGQVSSASLCRSFGGTAVYGQTVYVPCTDGVRAVSIDTTGHLHVQWHAASNVTGSPIVAGGRVWSLDPSGTLYSLDQKTGATKASIAVGATNRFATPALYAHHLVVPTLKGIAVVGFSA